MKKHFKEQFSNWLAPLIIILISVIAYFITEDVVYAISFFIRSSIAIIGLYIYGAVCAHEAELETRLEYEPEEPEV